MTPRFLPRALWAQILIALVTALGCGALLAWWGAGLAARGEGVGLFGVTVLTAPEGHLTLLGVPLPGAFGFVGELFLRGLQMLVVPLIGAAIVTAMANLGTGTEAFARLGWKTLLYYGSTSLLAILTGLVLVNAFAPGQVSPETREVILASVDTEAASGTTAKVSGRGAEEVVEVFLRVIPENVVRDASSNGSILGVIFFAMLFGFFLGQTDGPAAGVVKQFWDGVYQVMLRITDLVMAFAPLGVLGLLTEVVANVGGELLLRGGDQAGAVVGVLATYFVTVLLALGVHFFISLPLILALIARVSPWRHYRAMFPAILTAFSTASSSATLPVTLDCLQNRARVPTRVTNFMVPLGATVNMDGTALYECVVAMFLAQLLGFDLSLTTQFTVVTLALLTSVGVAGIPQASLVAIVVILNAIGFSEEQAMLGISLVLVTDRVLDMMRTTVNVYSDSVGAVVVASTEGARDLLPAQLPQLPEPGERP